MMRQFRKLLGWKQKKPRKSSGMESKRSASQGSVRKASTISLAMSSLGFSVQFSQSETQLAASGCSSADCEEATQKMASGNAAGNGHAKKRSTTSSPPDETAAGVPPRLPENSSDMDFRHQRSLTIDVMPRVEEGQEEDEVVSVFMRDYEDEIDAAVQAQLRDEMPPKTPRSVMMEDVSYEEEEVLASPSTAELESATTKTASEHRTETAAKSAEWQSEASLLTLPPELILEISKYLPFCSHTALYDTCGRLNRVIRDNNQSHYERELAKAGANPRGDSLLTRSIFAFQYLNRPSHAPESHPEFNIDSSFGYIRYLKAQSEAVQEIADLMQNDTYKKFLLSEEGKKMLRLAAHGSHEPEDLSHKDDVDRDLMHLWEFVNFSIDKMVRTEVPMYYPYEDQKTYYDSAIPFQLVSSEDDANAENLRKSVTKLGKDAQFPHDQFLVWERRRLRDLRNEYWKEDTDNLSKVESKDMRWILEVIKAIFVGILFKTFVEGPREKNRALMELKAKALRKASKNGTPSTPNDASPAKTPIAAMEERVNDWLLNTIGWPGAAASSEASTSQPSDSVAEDTPMTEDTEPPPYSQMYAEQEVRAYVAYLIANGGMKLLLELFRTANLNNGIITPKLLDSVLTEWDKRRSNSEVPAEHTKGFDAEKARGEQKAKNPSKEDFSYLWKPTRVERIWERDCKRGGWSNWEGWVAEYYLIA